MRKIILTAIFLLFCANANADVVFSGASISGVTKYNRFSSYETSSGTLIEGFEDSTQWTVSGIGGSVINNSNYDWATVRESQKSVSLIASQAGTIQIVKDLGSANNFTSAPNFLIWINPIDILNLTDVNVYFSSVADFSKNLKYNMHQNNYKYNAMWPRWNRVLMPKNLFVNTGSEDWSSIRYIKIEQVSTGSSTVNIDGLYHSYTLNKPKLILTFDDGLSGVINYAYPKMHANGQRGVAFINLSNIGGAGGMTQADLTTLYADGWDVSNHNGPGADAYTLGQISTYIDTGYSTLSDWGFSRSAKFYAYPSGQWQYPSYGMIQKLQESHVISRAVNQINVDQALPVFNENDPYGDGRMYLGSGDFVNGFSTSAATICGWIDQNITAGGLYILTFHDIHAPPIFSAFWYDNTKFNDVSDCIKTKTDAGTLELITFSDLYNSYLR